MLSVLQQVTNVTNCNTFMLHTSAYSRGKGKGKVHSITGQLGPEGE
jgi:hypothetical protein